MKSILIVAALLCVACSAFAEGVVPQFGIEANAVSFNQTSSLPSDFESGGVVSLSLSPHISAHGAVLFGLSRSYLRAPVGLRVTATDVRNQNFSVGFGLEYQASSKPSVRPQEIAATATAGIKLWPEQLPQVILGMQGGVGIKTGTPMLLIGATYALPINL